MNLEYRYREVDKNGAFQYTAQFNEVFQYIKDQRHQSGLIFVICDGNSKTSHRVTTEEQGCRWWSFLKGEDTNTRTTSSHMRSTRYQEDPNIMIAVMMRVLVGLGLRPPEDAGICKADLEKRCEEVNDDTSGRRLDGVDGQGADARVRSATTVVLS